MYNISSSIDYAYLPRAKRASSVDKATHHQLMDFEKVFHLARIDAFYRFVRRRRAQDFVNLPLRSNNLLSFEDGSDLFLCERISLDSG